MPRVICFQHIDCEGPGSLLDILKAKLVGVQILKPFKGDLIRNIWGMASSCWAGPWVFMRKISFLG